MQGYGCGAVGLFLSGVNDHATLCDSCVALSNNMKTVQHVRAVLEAGVAPILVGFLCSPTEDLKAAALCAGKDSNLLFISVVLIVYLPFCSPPHRCRGR